MSYDLPRDGAQSRIRRRLLPFGPKDEPLRSELTSRRQDLRGGVPAPRRYSDPKSACTKALPGLGQHILLGAHPCFEPARERRCDCSLPLHHLFAGRSLWGFQHSDDLDPILRGKVEIGQPL
jgi:hypothetical protein